MAFAVPQLAVAQISLTPENVALGGGGTSYLTGYEALFVNPANLQIRDKNYRVQFGLAQTGLYYESPLQIKKATNKLDAYLDNIFELNRPGELSNDQRINLIDRNYGETTLMNEFLSRGEVTWFGIKWFGNNNSYAVALRTRYASRYNIGRGYYDPEPVAVNGSELIEQSLTHRYQTLHELSIGYSSSFSFLNGLIPRLSEFIVGIAPKVVVSGAMQETEYVNRYERVNGNEAWFRETEYRFRSTGNITNAANRFQQGLDPMTASANFTGSDLFKPTGIGLGLDLGITYLITFGDDLSLVRRDEEVTEKSLRLSFSLTDLGAIYYYDDPVQFSSEREISEESPPGVSETYFTGSPTEDFIFLSQLQNHPIFSAQLDSDKSFETFLPTAFNAGALFQINRIRLMGDFSVGLQRTAMVTSKFISYVGAEIRPLSFLPLRAGTRFATEIPGYYSVGAGIETAYFDINAAVQFRSKAGGPTIEPVGASVVAIKFYLP